MDSEEFASSFAPETFRNGIQTYFMIGDPIAQVKSPDLFNAYFRKRGMKSQVKAVAVSPKLLEDFFSAMRSSAYDGGCIVTVPHKGPAFRYLDEATDRASLLRAVNVIRCHRGRLRGDMVDGLGFLAAMENRGFGFNGARVALIGAGGAGAAIAQAIAERGIGELMVSEIDPERRVFVERVVAETAPTLPVSFEMKSLAGIDLAINATPIGMNGDPGIPFPTDSLSPQTWVMDVVTEPKWTPWLQSAADIGCRVVHGVEMVQGQAGLMGRHMGIEIEDGDVEDF